MRIRWERADNGSYNTCQRNVGMTSPTDLVHDSQLKPVGMGGKDPPTIKKRYSNYFNIPIYFLNEELLRIKSCSCLCSIQVMQ